MLPYGGWLYKEDQTLFDNKYSLFDEYLCTLQHASTIYRFGQTFSYMMCTGKACAPVVDKKVEVVDKKVEILNKKVEVVDKKVEVLNKKVEVDDNFEEDIRSACASVLARCVVTSCTFFVFCSHNDRTL
jgi:hypothetical protein